MFFVLEEQAGFEPANPLRFLVFETSRLNRSRTAPRFTKLTVNIVRVLDMGLEPILNGF